MTRLKNDPARRAMILHNVDVFLRDEVRRDAAFQAGVTDDAALAAADAAARLAGVPNVEPIRTP